MSKSKDIKGKVQISTYDDILKSNPDIQSSRNEMGKPNGNEVVNIPLDQLHAFKNHPFRVVDDEEMQELVDSVSSMGVVEPIVVRAREEGGYEIVSGHRRKRASELAGVKDIPAIVMELDDNEAIKKMVDTNIHRENILPSEKANACKMRFEAEKKQGTRKRTTSDQVGPKSMLTVNKIGEANGISGTQVKRYIRLTFLVPELLKMVDDGKIPFTVAVDLSFFTEKEQKCIYDVTSKTGKTISAKQVKNMQELSRFGDFTKEAVVQIINGSPSPKRNVTLTDKDLKQYFSDNMDSIQIKELILEMIKQYAGGNGDGK